MRGVSSHPGTHTRVRAVSSRLVIEADGGSRGNPGPAAYGALVRDADTGEVLAEIGQTIGVTTNNVAEYRGLLAGLQAARAIDPRATVNVKLDSKLVVEQMSGRWKIKRPELREIAIQARDALPPQAVTYTWVPREENAAADALVNQALDGTPVDSLGASDVPDPREEARAEAHQLGGDMTRLILVRHGRTELTVARAFSGGTVPGPELDEVGRWQARCAGERLKGTGAVAVISSPMMRTRQTAEAIADVLGVAVEIDPSWRELEFGDWEGATYSAIADTDAGRRWGRDATVIPPGGESLDALSARISAASDDLLARFSGRTVVVVTHSMPVRVMTGLATGAPPTAVFRFRPLPASITEIDADVSGQMSVPTFGSAPWL